MALAHHVDSSLLGKIAIALLLIYLPISLSIRAIRASTLG
jgi:hypothetical protein